MTLVLNLIFICWGLLPRLLIGMLLSHSSSWRVVSNLLPRRISLPLNETSYDNVWRGFYFEFSYYVDDYATHHAPSDGCASILHDVLSYSQTSCYLPSSCGNVYNVTYLKEFSGLFSSYYLCEARNRYFKGEWYWVRARVFRFNSDRTVVSSPMNFFYSSHGDVCFDPPHGGLSHSVYYDDDSFCRDSYPLSYYRCVHRATYDDLLQHSCFQDTVEVPALLFPLSNYTVIIRCQKSSSLRVPQLGLTIRGLSFVEIVASSMRAFLFVDSDGVLPFSYLLNESFLVFNHGPTCRVSGRIPMSSSSDTYATPRVRILNNTYFCENGLVYPFKMNYTCNYKLPVITNYFGLGSVFASIIGAISHLLTILFNFLVSFLKFEENNLRNFLENILEIFLKLLLTVSHILFDLLQSLGLLLPLAKFLVAFVSLYVATSEAGVSAVVSLALVFLNLYVTK